MSKTEGDPLIPNLERRLRSELDRVQPRFSPPRYLLATRRPFIWRLAPAALAASLLGILSLSAYAATGSPNPVVWTEHVVTVIRPNPATPTPVTSPTQHRGGPATTPSQHDANERSPEPSGRPEPTEQPEPKSPEPSGEHSGGGSGDHYGSGTSTSGAGTSDSWTYGGGDSSGDSHRGSD
jgi:uncharacterized membrane protein YgcG